MIRWRYARFPAELFREDSGASHQDKVSNSVAYQVVRYRNNQTDNAYTHWRMDPINSFGVQWELALTWTAASGGTGDVVWEIAVNARNDGSPIVGAISYLQVIDTANNAGDRNYFTPFTRWQPSGAYGTATDDLWFVFEVRRLGSDAADTLNEGADLIELSIRYRVER